MPPIKNMTELQKAAKNLFTRAFTLGMNVSVSDLMTLITKETGVLDDAWVQKTTVEMINNLGKDAFLKVPVSERTVFIPHCMRSIKSCKAPVGEEGYRCMKCGACKIKEIVTAAEKRGMKWFIVGGGSQLINLIKKYKPHAVIGIACFNEIKLGLDKMAEMNIPVQAILLSRSGCVNTDAEMNEVLAKINM